LTRELDHLSNRRAVAEFMTDVQHDAGTVCDVDGLLAFRDGVAQRLGDQHMQPSLGGFANVLQVEMRG